MAGSTQHVVRQFSGEGANPHTLSLMWASNVEYDILRSVTAYMRPTAIQQLAVVGRSLAEGSSPATRWNQIFPDLHAQAAREDAASSAERPRTRNAPPASGDEPPELPFKISNAAKAGMLAICAMFADSKGDSAKPAREFSEWNLSHEKAEESIQRLKLCASELGIASNASQLTMKLYYAIPKSIRSEVVRLLPAGVSLQQASIDNLALALSSHTATTAYAEAFRPQAAVESGQRGGFRGTNRAFSTQARASSPDTHRPAAGGTDWRTAPDDGAAPRLCYACGKPGHIAARCPTRTEPRGASGRGGGAPQHAQRPAAPGGRGGRGQRPYVRQPNADGKNAQKSAFKAAAAVESEGGASLATLERDLSDLRELIESAQMGGSSRGEVQHLLRGISPSEWNVSVFQFVKSILSEITPEPFGLGPIMMADFFVEHSALIIIYGIYQTADREPTLNNAVATFLRHVGEPMPWDTRSFPEKRLLHLLIDNFAAAPLLLALPFVALAFDEMIPEFQCTVVTGLGGLGMCHAYSLWESDWSAAANPDTFCLTVLNLGCVARIQGPLVVFYRRYEAQPASSRLGVKSSSDNSRARRQLAASPDGDFIKKPQAKRGRTAASEQLRGHATTRGGLSARIMVGSHRNQFSGARYATTSAPIVRTAAAAIVADEYGTMMADKAQPSPNVLAPPPTAPLAAAPPPTAHPPSHAAAVASCSRQYGEAVDTLHELLAECPADSRRDIIASAVLQRMESELTLGSGLVNARVAQNIAATCSIVAVYDIISDSDVLMSAVAERLEACTVSVNDEGEALLRGSSTVQPLARSGVKQGPGGGNVAVGAAALDRGRPQRWSAAQKGKAKANGERALAAY